MSPDSADTRIRLLEQTVAALKQEVHDVSKHVSEVDHDVRAFGPLVAQMATLTAEFGHVQRGLNDLVRRFDERDRDLRVDSATERRWRVGTAVVIGLALVGVLVQIYLAANA